MISQRNKHGLGNPWVIGLAAIILSGVLINVYLVWRVFKTPVRLLDSAYTVKEHNRHDAKWVQQQAERARLGWHARLHSPQQSADVGQVAEGGARFVLIGTVPQIELELMDRQGRPVGGGQVRVTAQSPGDAAQDFSGSLYETAVGHYEGTLNFSRPGHWDLLIRAEQNDQSFEMEEKVLVVLPK